MKTIKSAANFFMCIGMALSCILVFAACGDDDDDPKDDYYTENGGNKGNNNNTGNNSGNKQTVSSLSQMEGYWINQSEYNDCKNSILALKHITSYDSSTLLGDPVLAGQGMSGYYIKGEVAYEIAIGATTTQYNNNSVEGNTVWQSWSFPAERTTVYFMNTVGGKRSSSCSLANGKLSIGWNNVFNILNNSTISDSNGNVYIHVSPASF